MTPAVTIIVPTYRRPAQLARALGSIPGALSAPREVIVVDDDPDGSGFEAARAAGAKYVWKAGAERGLSVSRNLGLRLARGRFLAFLDDDDLFVAGGLDALLEAATGFAGIVFGDYSTFDAAKRVRHDTSGLVLDHLLVCNQLPVGSYLIGRSGLLGEFDERMRSHEDWDFLLRHAVAQPLRHVAFDVVWVDKTENASTSMQARRREFFWLDFLSVYGRYPAPALSELRARMLASLDAPVPASALRFPDIV